MKVKVTALAAALSFLPVTGAFAACNSNINGGTVMNEGDCYMHSVGVAVGCHGGVIASVGGTTNKCLAWIEVTRVPSLNDGGPTIPRFQVERAPNFSPAPPFEAAPARRIAP